MQINRITPTRNDYGAMLRELWHRAGTQLPTQADSEEIKKQKPVDVPWALYPRQKAT